MTKVIKLLSIKNSEDFIDLIKDRELLIYEDIQGSQIFVKFNGKEFIIKPKSFKNDELNIIDLTIQKFYNEAYVFFNTLPEYVTDLINQNWWYVFEYFPDNQPAHVEYRRKPKNSLILTCIVKGNKFIYDYDEVKEYSNLFDVDTLPVLFKGVLSPKQLEAINLYLKTSEKDLNFIFGEVNFAKFFYNILNPIISNSFLMDNDEFNDNLEKIVIKVNGDEKYSFEILNPIYKKLSLTNDTEYVEVYSLILINFLQFCQLDDFDKYKLFKITKNELYIELICKLFNSYLSNVYKDLLEWNFNIPEFFKEDKFKINVDLLSNKTTIDYIKSDPKIEYIFKCILGSFNKKRKKPIGIFTETTVNLFNELVDKISNKLDLSLNMNREYELQKSDVLNFDEYFKLDFNVDNQGKVYPQMDIYSQFGEESGGEKKKKGKSVIPEKEISKKKETPLQ